MKNNGLFIVGIIIGIVAGLLIGCAGGYFYAHKQVRSDFGKFNNFQLNDEQKTEANSFFESHTNQTELDSYCKQNPSGCIYYCKDVNPDNEICSQLLNIKGDGMPPRR
jgi:hypothetical protein